MPGSATFWFADGVLKRYMKQWWCPFTGSNPKSGFAATTPRSKAVETYMGSRESWKRLGDDLIAKAFQDGGPFPDFEAGVGVNPKLKEPVFCETCNKPTMAYGETNKVLTRVDGSQLLDKPCDDCLSPATGGGGAMIKRRDPHHTIAMDNITLGWLNEAALKAKHGAELMDTISLCADCGI